ncbi:MAG: type III pantothenate kinase [Ignavibacteria bacterium]|nr:type III pantothenate kinase [Ignavibacteria bacterium]
MATLYDTKVELNNVEYGICGIDVGNSRVKIHHDDVFLSFPYDKDWKKNVQHHFRDHTTRRYLIGLSSVNPRQTTAIVKVLQRLPGHLVISIHSLMMRNEKLLSFGAVENAGIDRLLGAIGAMQQAKPPLITIDCGTAITINAVSEKNVFIGGAIFAGISTQLYGLAKQTAGIQEFSYSPPTSSIGVNTFESLMIGVTASVVGGATEIIKSMQTELFHNTTVSTVITGGEGMHLVSGLKANGIDSVYYKHLVTDGILSLLANAQRNDVQDAIIEKIRT